MYTFLQYCFTILGKRLFIFSLFILVFPFNAFSSSETEQLLIKLDKAIDEKENYLNQKTLRIKKIQEELENTLKNKNIKAAYDINKRLYEEYRSFIYDSAFRYVVMLNSLAHKLNDRELIVQSKIMTGFTLLSSGLFKESLDTLKGIDLTTVSDETKVSYYTVLARTYYDLADYNEDSYYSVIYRHKGNLILDSAFQYMSNNTAVYWLSIGLRRMKSDDLGGSADAFNFAISHFPITDHEFAISASSLGWIFTLQDRKNEAVDMLIKASIADIKTSTKETVALRNLAVLLFETGDIKRAYKFIKLAMEDANYYNARHRKMAIGAILPFIEGTWLSMVENQKKKLIKYASVITILIILVTIFTIITYFQFKKLKAIRKTLQETNDNLLKINASLLEANKIKEEYIGYFFNINSEYIDKIEALQKTVARKIVSKQYDDLSFIIKNSDLKKERENLFLNFDKIFLKLFPHFVEEFNALFKKEDRIILRNDELLNSDLRIYALIRLGITDHEKIAKFLNYSVNTIYTYKTKIKNKTIVDKDNFEEKIMEIKAI